MLLLSGGPDSTTLAYWLAKEGFEIETLTFEFGEREGEADRIAAQRVVSDLKTHHRHVNMHGALQQLYQTEGPIHTLRDPDKDSCIVSFGAGYALSLAISAAQEAGIARLYYGVHVEDFSFRENTPEFFASLSRAASIYWGKPFEICTPFLQMTKDEIVKLGNSLEVPWEHTWSCTTNSQTHCGECVSCRARRQSFSNASVVDLTTYQK